MPELLAEQPRTHHTEVHEYDVSGRLLTEAFNGNRRSPKSEIYGRSLSTIHRLGSYAVGRTISEIIQSPEADQARAEFYTSVEEGFGTDMELGVGLEVRDFEDRPVVGGRVMSKDRKISISDMTESGVICAEERAEKDPHFLPQLIRTYRDHENALIVDQMARGETEYNTRIVVSPFPEEAAVQSGSNYWENIGYVPHLKRGFVWVWFADQEGVVAGSLSFDGSNKERLREVFSGQGIDIPKSEVTDNWLRYPITRTLSKDEAKQLALKIAAKASSPEYKKTTNTVDITSEHRLIMDRVFNESYVHACESHAKGRQTPEARKLIFQLADKANSFGDRYATALYRMRANEKKFTDDDMIVLHEMLVYSTIEMMRALHIEKNKPIYDDGIVYQNNASRFAHTQSVMDPVAFQRALGGFGAEGARNNRTYSACGLSISLGGETREDDGDNLQSVSRGFSQAESEDGDCTFVSKRCPKCGAKNVLTKVTKTRITGSCGCSKRK